jgi:DNA-binding MarR family transcriptional regulator
MDTTEIDPIDYAVLKCLDVNGALWKKRMHRWVQDHVEQLPGTTEKSVQTIGRHTDRLHEAGLVESCIVSPDAVNRGMIIGYKLTTNGEEALAAKQAELLREIVIQSAKQLLGDDTDMQVDREPLIHLLEDTFDVDPTTRDEILPRVGTDELVGLLATHFFLDNADRTFDPDNTATLVQLLERTPQFRRPFETKNIITHLREVLAPQLTATDHTASATNDARKPANRR